MKGISRRIKRYVAVSADFSEEGKLTPTAVTWDDGRRFPIDRVLDARRAASLKTGGDGIRYTIRVGSSTTYLFFEDPRWFVEEKVADMP